MTNTPFSLRKSSIRTVSVFFNLAEDESKYSYSPFLPAHIAMEPVSTEYIAPNSKQQYVIFQFKDALNL